MEINDSKKPKTLEIGDKTEDGWAYVGENYGQNIFAKGYGVKKWKEAMKFAEGQNAHLGSDAELDLLQTALNKGLLKDSFDTSGSDPAGWAWGQRHPTYPGINARVQKLSDGKKDWRWPGADVSPGDDASAVLFQSEPRPRA
ncbi:MAG: hypothetical protein CO093_04995 [Alphaproteobacteria bacterium CG_4_9_14_3_um_filter_47_13]|nr:MAG: hypothetical protein CO093_04995 [Alphaproteobacteria bacterium CG_4_9_14_3_um_filter_47_13]